MTPERKPAKEQTPDVTGLVTRPSQEADVPALQAIYAHHVLHGFGSFEEVPPDVVELARRRTAVLARDLPYLVAEWDGALAGYAYAAPFRARSAYRFTVEDSIYVSPDFVGRGIGKALLQTLITRCVALGYHQMIAVIGGSQNIGSIKVHEACGFHHAGTLPAVGFKFDQWVDSIMMCRTLAHDPK